MAAVLAASGLAAMLGPERFLDWAGFVAVEERLVTGIAVAGTASAPVIYVTSSDPRVPDDLDSELPPIDTNSGVVSVLTRLDGDWERRDLVLGLPRSRHDHATNGLVYDRNSERLYIAQGSMTNMGAPAAGFGRAPEYALSGAILLSTWNSSATRRIALPTLDDETRAGSDDAGDPFGGNGGRNQAVVVPDGPVRLHATGLRNPYDVLLTRTGGLYTIDNGSNWFWGNLRGSSRERAATGRPKVGRIHRMFSTSSTLEAISGIRTRHGPAGTSPSTTRLRNLLSRDPGRKSAGTRAGRPTRSRSSARRRTDSPSTPRRTSTAPCQATWSLPASTGGSTESSSRSRDGGFSGSGSCPAIEGLPLDVTTQSDGGPFPGTIWAADWLSGDIVVLEPRTAQPAALGAPQNERVRKTGGVVGARGRSLLPRRRRSTPPGVRPAHRHVAGRRPATASGSITSRASQSVGASTTSAVSASFRSRLSTRCRSTTRRPTASGRERRCHAREERAASPSTTARSTTPEGSPTGRRSRGSTSTTRRPTLDGAARHASSARPLPGPGRRRLASTRSAGGTREVDANMPHNDAFDFARGALDRRPGAASDPPRRLRLGSCRRRDPGSRRRSRRSGLRRGRGVRHPGRHLARPRPDARSAARHPGDRLRRRRLHRRGRGGAVRRRTVRRQLRLRHAARRALPARSDAYASASARDRVPEVSPVDRARASRRLCSSARTDACTSRSRTAPSTPCPCTRRDAGRYEVLGHERIKSIRDIPNHDDDGLPSHLGHASSASRDDALGVCCAYPQKSPPPGRRRLRPAGRRRARSGSCSARRVASAVTPSRPAGSTAATGPPLDRALRTSDGVPRAVDRRARRCHRPRLSRRPDAGLRSNHEQAAAS